MIEVSGERIPEEDADRAVLLVDAVRDGHEDLFLGVMRNVLTVVGAESVVNVLSVLAQMVADLQVVVSSRVPAPLDDEHAGDTGRREVRRMDVQRLMVLAVAAADASGLSEQQSSLVWSSTFFDALMDPYGPEGRHWALQTVLNLAVALLAKEMTMRAARDEADAMDTLRVVLDEILGEQG